MEFVDNHCHIIAEDQERYPRAPLGGTQSTWATIRPKTAEQMLDAMDKNSISRAVLVQATTAYGYDNSYVIESARKWPDRFLAVGTFDPLAERPADRLAEAMEAGLVGVRLFTVGSTLSERGDWFADAQMDEFWEAATGLGITVSLQTRLSESYDVIGKLLTKFPKVRVLLDHCGYPDISADAVEAGRSLAELAQYANLYLKLTHRSLEPLAEIGAEARKFLVPVIDAFTSSRIAWGTNVPAAEQTHSELLDLAQGVLRDVSQADKEAIFAKTTNMLYGRDGDTI